MRLRRRAEYVAVQATVRSCTGVTSWCSRAERTDRRPAGRLGITVTKKVGNAVVRNRIRRLVREWMRLHGWVPTGWDVVVVAKDSAARQVHPDDFAPDLSKILRQLSP